MENLLSVHLEAHHPAKNHHRRYALSVGRDLFGDWTLLISHGRVGQTGREIRLASQRTEELQAMVHERLRRRVTAPRRIGCAYRLVELQVSERLEAESWLPRDLLGRFEEAHRVVRDSSSTS